MQELRSFDKVVFCGQSGTGKTTLERSILSRYKRVLVFDPDDEYEEYPDIRTLKKDQEVTHCRYIPDTDKPEELEEIAKLVWRKQNTLLMISEAEIYLPVYRGLLPWMFKLINRGRRRNIGCIADTRRVANLNKTVVGLAEWIVIFRHTLPNDLKYLREFVNFDPRALQELPDFHYWVCHRSKVTVHEPIQHIVIY